MKYCFSSRTICVYEIVVVVVVDDGSVLAHRINSCAICSYIAVYVYGYCGGFPPGV